MEPKVNTMEIEEIATQIITRLVDDDFIQMGTAEVNRFVQQEAVKFHKHMKKSIWHHASERPLDDPAGDSDILVIAENGANYLATFSNGIFEEIRGYEITDVKKWAYLSDII